MVRVKPEAIRGCEDSEDYWVVNGTTDEIRPYRILYKECRNEKAQNVLFGYNNNLFPNISNISLFENASNPFSEEIKFPKLSLLFMHPVNETNKIIGALEDEGIVKFEADFSQAFNQQDIQIKQFITGSAYCNFEKYLYITGGQEMQKDIGKIFLKISKNNNDIKAKILIMPMMNFAHWNHSMISNKDYIFSIGGYNSNKCELFNNNTLKWEKMHVLNSHERQRSMLVIYKDYLYCFMGYTQHEILNSCERIKITNNILINKWETLNINNESNSNLKFYGSGIFNYKDKLVFIGGKIGFGEDKEEDYKSNIDIFSFDDMKFNNCEIYYNGQLNFFESNLHYFDDDIIGNFIDYNDGCLASIKISSFVNYS